MSTRTILLTKRNGTYLITRGNRNTIMPANRYHQFKEQAKAKGFTVVEDEPKTIN